MGQLNICTFLFMHIFYYLWFMQTCKLCKFFELKLVMDVKKNPLSHFFLSIFSVVFFLTYPILLWKWGKCKHVLSLRLVITLLWWVVFSKGAVLLFKADMQLIQLILCHVLLITTILYTTEAITEGCGDWELHGTDDVCCIRCNPGRSNTSGY